jgi:hypothetical protein
VSLGPPSGLGADNQERLRSESEAIFAARSVGKTASMPTCRRCGQTIEGPGFGSPETGWEHPFDGCPEPTTDPEPFFAIRRLDGELVYGEFSWVKCDGPDDWDAADESEHDEDTEYEIVEMRPRRVAARRYFGSMLCPDCSGDGWLPDSGEDGEVEVTCSTCEGKGERDEKWETI